MLFSNPSENRPPSKRHNPTVLAALSSSPTNLNRMFVVTTDFRSYKIHPLSLLSSVTSLMGSRVPFQSKADCPGQWCSCVCCCKQTRAQVTVKVRTARQLPRRSQKQPQAVCLPLTFLLPGENRTCRRWCIEPGLAFDIKSWGSVLLTRAKTPGAWILNRRSISGNKLILTSAFLPGLPFNGTICFGSAWRTRIQHA